MMRCPTCQKSLLRNGATDIALLTRRLVVDKSTREIRAVCPTCKTPVPLPVEMAKAMSRALLLEVTTT